MTQNKKAKIHGLAAQYGLATHARNIWNEHPYVRSLTEQAFHRLGYLSLDNGASLLIGEAIRDGVVSYNLTTRLALSEPAPVCYLRAFFESLARVLAFEIMIGEVRWQPLKSAFTDLVGEIQVTGIKVKWPTKAISPLEVMVLAFMDEESSAAVLACRLPREGQAHKACT